MLKRSPRFNRNLVIVCGLVSATQMSWGVVIPVLPVYAESLGASATQLGLVVSLFGVGRLAANIPAGRIAERVDQRIFLIISVVAVALLMIATGFVQSLEQLLLLRVLTGIAGGCAVTVGNSYIVSTSEPSSRGRAMGLLHAFQLAGGALGPSLGGVVAGTWGYAEAFLVSSAVALMFTVWALFHLDSAPPLPRSSTRAPDGSPRRSWLLADATFLAVCIVGFAVFLTRFGGQQFLVPVLAYDAAGLNPTQLGLILGGITTINICLAFLVGWLTDRYGAKMVIVPTLAAGGLFSIGYLWADITPLFLAILAITGILQSFSGPAPAAFLAHVAPPGRHGSSVGIYRTFGDVGAVLGPAALGAMIDGVGSQFAVLTLVSVSVVAAIWFAIAAKEPPPIPKPVSRQE